MNKKDLDLSVFKYPPFTNSTYRTISKLPEFDFPDKYFIDLYKFIDYIILLHDINSPLKQEFPFTNITEGINYPRRKFEAAKLAGFNLVVNKKREKVFEKNVEDMLLGNIDYINTAIVRYIFLFGSPAFAGLAAFEAILFQKVKESFSGTGSDKKDVEAIKMLYKDISDLTNTIYGGKETAEATKALYSFIEQERLNIFPEDIGEMLQNNGKLPIDFSPYQITEEQIKNMQEWKSRFLGKSKNSLK